MPLVEIDTRPVHVQGWYTGCVHQYVWCRNSCHDCQSKLGNTLFTITIYCLFRPDGHRLVQQFLVHEIKLMLITNHLYQEQ